MNAGIFNNSLYSVITSIIGGIIFVAALLVTALSFLDVIGFDPYPDRSDPTVFSNIGWMGIITFEIIADYAAAPIGSVVILFILAVVAAILYRKSLTALAQKSGVGLFGTAGLLLLIGAISIIAFGFLLIWIALILLTVAFFQIRTEPTSTTPTMTPS
jgi:uncharacterized membrane protein